MATERLSFAGARGDRLAARLELPPDRAPRAWALFAHCFTCSKNLQAAVHLTRELSNAGFGVLRFDFTGLGESEGDFADTDFSSNVEDVVAAARHMETELGAPALLVGHSLGGAAVLHAAGSLPSVRAVATLGAPSDPAHVLTHVAEARQTIEERGEATVVLAGRPFTIRRSFLENLEEASMRAAVEALDAALLIMHSPVDLYVGIHHAARLYDRARHPKSFVSLDDADHLLTDEADARYAARVLAAWAGRYLPEVPEPSLDERIERDRVVARTGAHGFRTDLSAGGHALVADEPRSLGGEDAGPSPYDLVLAGLGACTAMTVRMYADRKGWPLTGARVRLRHRKLHAKDEDDCAESRGDPRLDRVEREVVFEGPLDDEQRRRLLEIAERCPVHRTLEAGVRVDTRLAGG
jgi:putative redox protein